MRATVRDVMTTKVIAITISADFKQIVSVLRRYRVSACPVINGAGEVIGVVSEADLLCKVAEPALPAGLIRLAWKLGEESKVTAVTAGQLMTSPAVTIQPGAPVAVAARVMQDRRIKRLPVVGPGGVLIGLVSRADVLSVYERPDPDILHDVTRGIIAGEFSLGPGDLEVNVASGIVTLTGLMERRDTALELLARIRHAEGVVAVRDRLVVAEQMSEWPGLVGGAGRAHGEAAYDLPRVPRSQDQQPLLASSATGNAAGMEHASTSGSARSRRIARPTRQVIDDLLRAAVAAPSMHNTQPWRFRVSDAGRVIELYADPARQLRCGDPSGRAAHIACGAALLNLRVAAEVAGWQPVVLLLPDPSTPLLLATVRLSGSCEAGEAERELHVAINRRHTNRQPFSSKRVPQGVLAELREAATLEGAILHFLDHNEAIRVLRLAYDAERAQRADPAYQEELARWAGGQRDRDGIPDSALGPRSPDGATPVRDFTPGRQPGPVRYAWFETDPQLAVLSTRSGSTADWLRAGQALQRVLLTATARGISASPLTQPLEANAWLVRDTRSGIEQPQMILRLGYGLPIPPAPRRPVSDVIDAPEPDEIP